ncbi:MAG: DUF4860 domain-containing protein [Oscillospiraceae bacterium]
MKASRDKNMLDLLLSLALLCVFAASSLMVVIIGANTYGRTASGMEANFSLHTSLSYLSEKLRQNDTSGTVSIENLGASPALVLTQERSGSTYRTYIYYFDGALCELFARAEVDARPESGQRIATLSAFSVEEMQDGLYRLCCAGTDGAKSSTLVYLRSTPQI